MLESKVGGFFVGLLGAVAIDVLAYSVAGTRVADPILANQIAPVVVTHVVLLVLALLVKRPYIALGVVVAGAAPILVFAACVMAFGSLFRT